MNKYDDIEQLLSKLADENPEEMDNIDDIDDSVFERIEASAIKNATGALPKRSNYFFLKAVAALIVLFGLFSIALYMFEMPNTRATEDPAFKVETTPLYQAHEINFPEFIPDGYELEYVVPQTDKNGYPGYEIMYKNAANEGLYILIRVYGDPINYDLDLDREVLEYNLNGLPFLLTKVYSNPITIYASFSDGWGDTVQIAATLNEEELVKVAESMH